MKKCSSSDTFLTTWSQLRFFLNKTTTIFRHYGCSSEGRGRREEGSDRERRMGKIDWFTNEQKHRGRGTGWRNGVTPGRQRTCWCEAMWGGEGDGVGEVPAFFPWEILELSLLCTHIKLYMCEGEGVRMWRRGCESVRITWQLKMLTVLWRRGDCTGSSNSTTEPSR